jgi:oxygen-independent coproporphyrinogen-3 oxidase
LKAILNEIGISNKQLDIMDWNVALYVHMPFCRRKCSYCSFVSYQNREADISAYIEALKREMAVRIAGRKLSTIYFGGGTPTLLSSDQVTDVLSTIHRLCIVDGEAEITMEANPGTVTMPYLGELKKMGINRLSLGVQSLNSSELDMLSRIHSAAEAREAVYMARDAGFRNLNIDLIYGLPGQSSTDWQHTLDETVKLNPEHLSLYPLTLEGDEPMSLAIERGELPSIDADIAAANYELAEDVLAAHDYQHYEISNWAKEGYKCRHNLVYWQQLPYIGVGVAAHSYLGGHRLANTRDLDAYINAFKDKRFPALEMDEEISSELQCSEAVILGLRLEQGIDMEAIRNRFNIDLLSRFAQQVSTLTSLGLLECGDRHLRLTRRGRLLGNEVFWQFLPG